MSVFVFTCQLTQCHQTVIAVQLIFTAVLLYRGKNTSADAVAIWAVYIFVHVICGASSLECPHFWLFMTLVYCLPDSPCVIALSFLRTYCAMWETNSLCHLGPFLKNKCQPSFPVAIHSFMLLQNRLYLYPLLYKLLGFIKIMSMQKRWMLRGRSLCTAIRTHHRNYT